MPKRQNLDKSINWLTKAVDELFAQGESRLTASHVEPKRPVPNAESSEPVVQVRHRPGLPDSRTARRKESADLPLLMIIPVAQRE